ncbi:MAG TPA: cupin domain-containing protein [Beijerinckiaceae bacterium]|jgi:uncharacterized protein YjlB
MAEAKAYGEAQSYNAPLGTEVYVFSDDNRIPNNTLPLVVRRGAITPDSNDPPSAFERVFEKNGWTNTWRDGIFDYHHYHSNAHEVLGIVSGTATVMFGGEGGETIPLTPGDVVVIPAGVGHALINDSGELAVVGAYAGGVEPDIIRDDPPAIVAARKRVAAVPLPDTDPIDGANGPLAKLWSL